jgi:hypothetical protein
MAEVLPLSLVRLSPERSISSSIPASALSTACVRAQSLAAMGKRIEPALLPPRALVAAAVELPMMQPADGDGEAVADLAPHSPLSGKLDVVGI